MAARRILLLGEAKLWRRCAPVRGIAAPATRRAVRDLQDTLADFRKRNGFGRGIAAPQIGVLKRIIYIYFPKEGIDSALINPRIVWQGAEKVELWDDCFSFPDLLVKVERAREIQVEYISIDGENCLVAAQGDLSELLQHEIDHLDGILAVERAIDGKSFALRSEWKREKAR